MNLLARIGAFLCLGIASFAMSQTAEVNPGSPIDEDLIRVSYHSSSDMPDEVAFNILLDGLEPMGAGEEGDVAWIMQEMQIDQETANTVNTQLLNTRAAMRKEQFDTQKSIGCTSENIPKFYGINAMAAMQDMEDSREVVAAKHLANLLQSLDGDLSTKLHDWIDNQKLRSSQVKYDHVEAYQRRGLDADSVLAGICLKKESN